MDILYIHMDFGIMAPMYAVVKWVEFSFMAIPN